MRIEKINDHQIRCIVTSADLRERRLTMKELRYGNQATMDLFHEVVQEASSRYGFNEEEFPLMIEAVPLNAEELMITISAIEETEELDPHFAQFAPMEEAESGRRHGPFMNSSEASPFLPVDDERFVHNHSVFFFRNIDDVMTFCHLAAPSFHGNSLLYRIRDREGLDEGFYLAMTRPSSMSSGEFNALLNTLSEYGESRENAAVLAALLKEHETPVMENPIQLLY